MVNKVDPMFRDPTSQLSLAAGASSHNLGHQTFLTIPLAIPVIQKYDGSQSLILAQNLRGKVTDV